MAKLTADQRIVLDALDFLLADCREDVVAEKRHAWDELIEAGMIKPVTIYTITPAGRLALREDTP